MPYKNYITLSADVRGGKPCIRGMRISVYDILNMMASGMTISDILEDFPELTQNDILAVFSFAASRESRLDLETV